MRRTTGSIAFGNSWRKLLGAGLVASCALGSENRSPRNFALNALHALPAFEPVARVGYESGGRLLVLADSASYAALKLPSLP